MVGEITLLNSLIGLKFTQTLKVKPHEIRLYTFSCASGSLLVFTSISYLLFLTFSRICSPVR